MERTAASRKKSRFVLPVASLKFLISGSLCQARERTSKDRALQAYEAVNHARMLAAQGDEDTRQADSTYLFRYFACLGSSISFVAAGCCLPATQYYEILACCVSSQAFLTSATTLSRFLAKFYTILSRLLPASFSSCETLLVSLSSPFA